MLFPQPAVTSLSVQIIHRHTDFLVTAKPANLGFHAEDDEAGFVAAVRATSGESELYPVHRLDKITSGLVLFARTAEAARKLGEMFASGQINKYYLALSARSPRKKQGLIKGGMVKARNGSWRLTSSEGAEAVTQFFSYGLGNGLRLFVLRPRTGRTHQLRVALKSQGSPIYGDERYGGESADRGYLHAYALRFDWHGEAQHFMLPPDEGLAFAEGTVKDKLAEIGEPETLAWPKLGAEKEAVAEKTAN